jgi:hypothetical protein
VLVGTIWSSRKIYACWENPEDASSSDLKLVQQAVTDTWQKSSGLTFSGWQKCAKVNRGIRIRIDDSGPHTKGLGSQLDGKPDGMVLNFTFQNWGTSCQQKRDYCMRAIAVHEFGHAIGFAHEQNRPDAPGECMAIAQGPNGDKLLTTYDPKSAMNYCNAKYNNDGELSELDVTAVQFLYGSPSDKTIAQMAPPK